MPNYEAHLPRTGFDMSQSMAFTSAPGMILPVYQDLLNVGETVYLNGSLFGRTQNLLNASMCDVDFYIDWFFVPLPMLYQLFPSIRYQTNDYFSSSFQGEVTANGSYLPLAYMNELVGGTANEGRRAQATSQVFSVGGKSSADAWDCYGKQTFRLLNHFGFNPYGMFNGWTGAGAEGQDLGKYASQQNPNVFPLYPLAYQAIFQNYFRIEDREKPYQLCCNFDYFHDQQSDLNHKSIPSHGVFQLRYRPRHKDYFTSVKVSPILSSMSLLDGNNTQVGQILSKVNNYLSSSSVSDTDKDGNGVAVSDGILAPSFTQVSSSIVEDSQTVTTGSIRTMFAVEKLMRIIGRSKKDYDSQVLAHFGFKVPHDVKHQLTHIFTQHGILRIGSIASTSDTYDSVNERGRALGSTGGQGYFLIEEDKKSRKFTAPVDGVVMAVVSSAPRYRYNGTFDKQNAITSRLDFYTPEFDKLGMQPLYAYEAKRSEIGTSKRLGWQLRYEQFKRKYDRCTEAFRNDQQGVNYFKTWLLGRESFFNFDPTGIPYAEDFYVSPSDLDSIMYVPYNGAWSDDYAVNPYLMFSTDPFINDFRANVKKVSTMSTYGEPEL